MVSAHKLFGDLHLHFIMLYPLIPCLQAGVQLTAIKKASSEQTAVIIAQEEKIEDLCLQLASVKQELQQTKDLPCQQVVNSVSRACSPVDAGFAPAHDGRETMQDIPDMQPFFLSDVRSMLEQLNRQLNAARLENICTNQCKYGPAFSSAENHVLMTI